jgi:hypothetical protein
MNDFKKVYETWSDDQLLEAYKQRSGYQEEAVEALQQVMTNRNLAEKIHKVQSEEKEEGNRLVEKAKRTEQEEEIRLFGKYTPDVEFAKNVRKEDGTYYESKLARDTNNFLFPMILAAEIILIVIAVIYINLEGWGLPGTLLIFCTVIFLFIAYRTAPRKASMKLYENYNSQIILEIKQKSGNMEIKFPFSYEFLTTTIAMPVRIRNIPLKIKNPYLYFLAERKDGPPILIHETLASWDHEPNWESPQDHTDRLKNSITFSIIGISKKKLKTLKKILDGLSEKK